MHVLQTYLRELRDIRSLGAGVKETSYYPALSDLLNAGGKPQPLKDGGLAQGKIWIAQDVIESIEKDRQPPGNMYGGRAALEMILAVYESHGLTAAGRAAAEKSQAPADDGVNRPAHSLALAALPFLRGDQK
jgi:hypothetical protein